MVKIKSILSVLAISVALIGYLPLRPYLDSFGTWFFPAALAFGFWQQRSGRFLSEKLLTPASLLLFFYFAMGVSQENLLSVTANLLVVFLAIRMLGEKSGRNYLQIFALSLFCLAASSLYNLSAQFLVYLLALLLLLAVSLVVLTFHAHDAEIALAKPELKRVLGVAGLMPVASLPILLVLFVLLPRTQFPLWDFLNRGGGTRAGFSDEVKPGSFPSVSVVKTVVLRVLSPKVPDSRLYWRGVVLNGFKGDAWVRLPEPVEKASAGGGQVVHQEIYPEPSTSAYLVALNIPRQISGLRTTQESDFVFKSRYPLDKRVKYEADSTLADVVRVNGGIQRDFYLALPGTVPQRLRAQAQALARPGLSSEEKLRLVERFFRNQRIAYATTNLPVGPGAVDDFLFVKKRGNCEFFASSAAILLRLAGVPARLVGGYRGGNYNEMGGYYQVTDDMAHVWVEAYLDGKGWFTVDPTSWSVGFAAQRSLGKTLRLYVDAVGFYWNKAVLTYDLDKQISLLKNAGSKAKQLRLPTLSAKGVLGALFWLLPIAAIVAWLLWRPASGEERVLRRFLRVVARRYPGVSPEGSGLFDLAKRIRDPRVDEFVGIYGSAVYGDRRLRPDELAALRKIVGELGKHPS